MQSGRTPPITTIEKLIKIPPSEKEIIRDFYLRTITRFAGPHLKQMQEKVQFIVVGHLVPTLPFYLEALATIGTIAVLVPKGSVPDPHIKTWSEKWLLEHNKKSIIFDQEYLTKYKEIVCETIDILTLEQKKCLKLPLDKEGKVQEERLGTREFLAIIGKNLIDELCDQKIIIIDIGGYFAHYLRDASEKVLGMVEDTENGQQLYEEVIKKFTNFNPDGLPPIISVARSQIKDSEDYNVGKAITDATDHILRTEDYTHLAESKKILIIGYGKIGTAAARVASEKTRGIVLICEKEPVRRLKASAHSFTIVTLEDGLKEADIILSCTGKKALGEEHFHILKDNVYIASCTSRDGEFNKTFLSALDGTKRLKNLQKNKTKSNINRYLIRGKTINLLNDGNSVNFVEKAVHGYFIHGVLASLAVSAIRIYLNSLPEPNIPHSPGLDSSTFSSLPDSYSDNVSAESRISNSLVSESQPLSSSPSNYSDNVPRSELPIPDSSDPEHSLDEQNYFDFVSPSQCWKDSNGLDPLNNSEMLFNLTQVENTGLKKPPEKLKLGILNDFNDLKETGEEKSASYQSLISEILMREKLRAEPLLTNHKPSGNRYIPREKEFEILNNKLKEKGLVQIVGGKKYGKSQLVEEFYTFHNSRYDLIWKFDALSSLATQFDTLISKINTSEKLFTMGLKIDIDAKEDAVQQVNFFLQQANLSYLLVFENIDALGEINQKKQEPIEHKINIFKNFIPKRFNVKREHIIVTSDRELLLNTIGFESLKLESFPTLELFKFLLNNNNLWEERSHNFNRLVHTFVYPRESISIYRPGKSIKLPDEIREEFVGISEIFSAFIHAKPEYDWETILIKNKVPPEGYRDFFLTEVIKELDEHAKKLLFLFYSVDFEELACSISSKTLEKFATTLFSSSKSLTQLKNYGLVEESNGMLTPKLHNVKEKQIKIIEKETQIGDVYQTLCKEFVITSTVKQFCNTAQISLLRMVEKIVTGTTNSNSYFFQWKEKNRILYCKLLSQLGNIYLKDKDYSRAIDFYEKAVFEYNKPSTGGDYKLAKLYEKLSDAYNLENASQNINDNLKGFPHKAIDALQNSLKLYTKLEKPLNIARVQKSLILSEIWINIEANVKNIQDTAKVFAEVNQSELINFYTDLGKKYKDKGEFKEAGKYYDLAHESYEQARIEISDTFKLSFAALLNKEGRYEKAVTILEELRTLQKLRTVCHSKKQFIMTLLILGQLYERLEKYEEGLTALEDACDNAKRLCGEESLHYGVSLAYKGKFYKSYFATSKKEAHKLFAYQNFEEARKLFVEKSYGIQTLNKWGCEIDIESEEKNITKIEESIDECLDYSKITYDQKAELHILKARLELRKVSVDTEMIKEQINKVIVIHQQGKCNLETVGDAYSILGQISKNREDIKVQVGEARYFYSQAFGRCNEKHSKLINLNKMYYTKIIETSDESVSGLTQCAAAHHQLGKINNSEWECNRALELYRQVIRTDPDECHEIQEVFKTLTNITKISSASTDAGGPQEINVSKKRVESADYRSKRPRVRKDK